MPEFLGGGGALGQKIFDLGGGRHYPLRHPLATWLKTKLENSAGRYKMQIGTWTFQIL